MITHLAALAAEKSAVKGFLGALHPGVIHFPIALLSVAALLEIVQIVRRKPEPAPGTAVLAYLAAAAAVPAAFFGFMLADYSGEEGKILDWHKWLGIASTVLALSAAACAVKARTCAGSRAGLRISLILGTGLVLITGYLGGELVFGEGHIMKFIFSKETPKTEEVKDHGVTPPTPGLDKVDFVRDVAPILKNDCFKCHGGEKVKGKFKLSTKHDAIETPAESGKAIIPGKPSNSKFYTSLIDTNEDDVMPPIKEKNRPTKEQIELLRKWIEQGAVWPDGFEIKK